MLTTIVEAECVNIHCFLIEKEQMFNQINQINPSLPDQQSPKIIKIVFFVKDLSLKDYNSTLQSLKKCYQLLWQKYSINLLMVKNVEEMNLLISQLRAANDSDFQSNYLKLETISKNQIQAEMLQKFVQKKLKWSNVRAKYFLQKKNIKTVSDLLSYKNFPQYETLVVQELQQLINHCQNSRKSQ